jgi:hypothetical protein
MGLALGQSSELLQPLDRRDVEQPIRMLAAALNVVETHYRRSRTFYGDILMPLSEDGQALTELLRRGHLEK